MAAIASFSVAHENGQMPIDSQTPKTYSIPGLEGNQKKREKKN